MLQENLLFLDFTIFLYNKIFIALPGPGESHRPLSLPPSSLNVLQTNPFVIKKVKDIREQLQDKDGGLELEDIKHIKNINKILQLLGGSGSGADRPQEPFNKNNNGQCSGLKKASSYHYIQRMDACVPECRADISFSGKEKSNF